LESGFKILGSQRRLIRASLIAAGAVLGWGGGGAFAQVLDPCPVLADPLFQVLPAQISCPLAAPFAAGHQEVDEGPALSPGRAFLYSALLPGLGQRKLGKGRWIAYLAVEGAAWIAFGHSQLSATDERSRYQDLAWDVARTFNGAREDGDFPYYEKMEKFLASGSFDTDPTSSGIQPEMDTTTFNGRAWSLATEIHFPPGTNPGPGDPEYEAALADYRVRAYDERFEWTWEGQSAAWTDYMELIDSSDSSFRRASQFLGVIIANHLLSGIDAFMTARVQGSAGSQAEAQIRLVPRDDTKGLALVFQVRH
jgi:hypothetical protein